MLLTYQLNTPNVSYGSVQKLVITWRQPQLKIFWDPRPQPLPCCDTPLLWTAIHPNQASSGLVFCPPSCSHPGHVNAIALLGVGCAAQPWEGSFTFFFLVFSSNGKSSCLPLGAGVFSTTFTKSSSWEFIFWLPLSEQTDFFRLLRNKTRIAFNIHWIFFGGGGRITCPLNILNTMSFNVYFGINTCFTFYLNSSL